jgi:hypothetical protein
MYQDKIKNEAEQVLGANRNHRTSKSIFEIAELKPLSFSCEELSGDAIHIARDILSTRTDEDIITLSKAVKSVMELGDNLFIHLAVKLIDSGDRNSVALSEGRALYLFCDYFALDTIPLKNVQWGEMFATLTLMQVAEIQYTKKQSQSQSSLNSELSDALNTNVPHVIAELKQEIIDSIARAECLYDKRFKASKSGSSGGEAKAKRFEPLKSEVIKRYLKRYQEYSDRKAGMIIEEELKAEKSELLGLSESEEMNIQFSKWIGAFKNGKWQFPIAFEQ